MSKSVQTQPVVETNTLALRITRVLTQEHPDALPKDLSRELVTLARAERGMPEFLQNIEPGTPLMLTRSEFKGRVMIVKQIADEFKLVVGVIQLTGRFAGTEKIISPRWDSVRPLDEAELKEWNASNK